MILFCQTYQQLCDNPYCHKNLSCGLGTDKKPLQFETWEEYKKYVKSLKTKESE